MDCPQHEKVTEKINMNEANIRVHENRIDNNEKDIDEMKKTFNKLSDKVLSIQIKVAIGSVIFYTAINLALWFLKQGLH